MKIATAVATAQATATAALFNNGKLWLYTGAQPTNGNTAGSGTVLAKFTLPATAFGAPALNPSTGISLAMVLTANAIGAITTEAFGVTPLVAVSYVCFSSTDVLLCSGSVGGISEGTNAGKDLVLNTATLGQSAALTITAFTHTIPM
jgi:hypothetical protein